MGLRKALYGVQFGRIPAIGVCYETGLSSDKGTYDGEMGEMWIPEVQVNLALAGIAMDGQLGKNHSQICTNFS
jgi:hypothetical protein